MKPKVKISHEQKLVTSICSEALTPTDMIGYFETLLAEIPKSAGYREVVDFTKVSKFEIFHDDFLSYSKKAAEVFASNRVVVTEFIVSNNLQFGMARMFSSMAEEGGVNFIITKRNWISQFVQNWRANCMRLLTRCYKFWECRILTQSLTMLFPE